MAIHSDPGKKIVNIFEEFSRARRSSLLWSASLFFASIGVVESTAKPDQCVGLSWAATGLCIPADWLLWSLFAAALFYLATFVWLARRVPRADAAAAWEENAGELKNVFANVNKMLVEGEQIEIAALRENQAIVNRLADLKKRAESVDLQKSPVFISLDKLVENFDRRASQLEPVGDIENADHIIHGMQSAISEVRDGMQVAIHDAKDEFYRAFDGWAGQAEALLAGIEPITDKVAHELSRLESIRNSFDAYRAEVTNEEKWYHLLINLAPPLLLFCIASPLMVRALLIP